MRYNGMLLLQHSVNSPNTNWGVGRCSFIRGWEVFKITNLRSLIDGGVE